MYYVNLKHVKSTIFNVIYSIQVLQVLKVLYLMLFIVCKYYKS